MKLKMKHVFKQFKEDQFINFVLSNFRVKNRKGAPSMGSQSGVLTNM